MKKIFKIALLFMAVTLVTPVVTSCSEDTKEETTTADTAALKAEIEECEALLNAATTDDYPQEAIDNFRKIVDQAKAVLESNPSQTAVDNLLTQLQKAKESFLAAAYDALPTEQMICAWDFETEGDEQVSTGTKAWKAVLAAGPEAIFGSDTFKPQFKEGEGVNGGNALYFDNGAHLEVSDIVESELLKNELSISVWVKPVKTVAGNYIISYNYWNTFKLNLESENKPFFTVATEQGIIDADNERAGSVKENEWAHLVVTMSYTDHQMKFYVNGEETKVWDETGKPQLASNKWAASYESPTGNVLPLMIGACTTYEEASTWDWFTPSKESWDCFHGTIDQVKIFTVALTNGQVKKLYNDEKGE